MSPGSDANRISCNQERPYLSYQSSTAEPAPSKPGAVSRSIVPPAIPNIAVSSSPDSIIGGGNGVSGNSSEELVGQAQRHTRLQRIRHPAGSYRESEPVRSGRLFALGHVDVALPLFLPYGALFLHAMASEPELIDRYMEVTTEGVLRVLQAQLDLGVDGICGANDWCYNKGPMMSPRMFRRFVVPHLKRIVDACHRSGVPYVKHLDGNTKLHLPVLVDEVGIDAYHSIEPSAGMDIGWVKQQFGDRLTVIGNIDCGDVMVNATPEEIRRHCREIIRVASPGVATSSRPATP
jgi:hypothetical protein